MKVLLVLALVALSAAQSIDTFEAEETNPEFEDDAAYDATDDALHSSRRDAAGDAESEFPFLRTGTFLPEDSTTNDTAEKDLDVDRNETRRPTILEIIIGRPLFPMRPLFPVRPVFQMEPSFPFGPDESYDGPSRTPSGDVFSDFFGPDFGIPDVKDLPPNYENSTYEVKDINGTKVQVNQTIDKKSGDGFDSFFHFKVIKVVPENTTDTADFPTRKVHPEFTPGKEAESEAVLPESIDDSLNQLDSKYNSTKRDDIGVQPEERGKRSIDPSNYGYMSRNSEYVDQQLPYDREEFYPSTSASYEGHPIFRNQNYNPKLPNTISRNSYVYKNMDGGQYSYPVGPPHGNDHEPRNFIPRPYPKGSSVYQYPTGSSVYQYPTGSSVYQYPTGSSVYQYPKESSVYQYPKESSVYQYPKESSLYQYPKGSSVYQYPKSSMQFKNINFPTTINNGQLLDENVNVHADENHKTNDGNVHKIKNVNVEQYSTERSTDEKTTGSREQPEATESEKVLVDVTTTTPIIVPAATNGNIPKIPVENSSDLPKKNIRIIPVVKLPKLKVASDPSITSHSRSSSHPVASEFVLVPVTNNQSFQSLFSNYIQSFISNYINSGDNSKKSNYKDDEVETFMVVQKPPDLSRDTWVNKAAHDNQQGYTSIDPDVEVFDLSLVLKELNSHKNVQL